MHSSHDDRMPRIILDMGETKYAVIGADGQIGTLVVKELLSQSKKVVAVSLKWRQKPFGAAVEYREADARSGAGLKEAVAGCKTILSVMGLPYSTKVWQADWTPMTKNVLLAARQAGSRLVYLDNVYAYGLVRGEMTEDTPYNPCSKKGQARAEAAALLQEAMAKGDVPVIIARSADYIGEGAARSIVGERFFTDIAQGQEPTRQAEWLGDPRKIHCYGYTQDVAKALILLGDAADSSYGQTWHLPALPPITGVDLSGLIAKHIKAEVTLKPMRAWKLRFASPFVPMAREQLEMQYQVEKDYVFSDKKFRQAYPKFPKTTWDEVIQKTLEFFGQAPSSAKSHDK